ncbi:hypothetical protein CR513_62413, partial [Mucuna pruriens]
MEAMATNLRTNAADSSRHRSASAPAQLELVIDSGRYWKSDDFSIGEKSTVSRKTCNADNEYYQRSEEELYRRSAGAVARDPKREKEKEER